MRQCATGQAMRRDAGVNARFIALNTPASASRFTAASI
jgi:hypothetical protein